MQSGRQRLVRLCGIFVLFLALTVGSSAVWAGSESRTKASGIVADVAFAAPTRVVLFEPGAGQWVLAAFGQAKPGNEFYFANRLYRVSEAGKAEVVPFVDAVGLFEADRASDKTSRRPVGGDVVQVLDKDQRFVAHAFFYTVKPPARVRFQGRDYTILSQGIATAYSVATSTLQRIEITKSALQHISDRHTVGGAMNAGKSVFDAREDAGALIRNAQLLTPTRQESGNCQRVFDAGRNIGVDRASGRQTSAYTVITTESGKLVTAFPGLP